MAPNKKQQLSPFMLFLTKMKRDNHRLKTMPFQKLMDHCDPIYKQLPPQVGQQLKQLSADVRKNLITESGLNQQLDALDLSGKTSDQMNNTSEGRDTEIDSKPLPIGAMAVKEEVSDKEEPDITAILTKTLKSFNTFANETIVVISFNILVKTWEGEYVPIEVGITKVRPTEEGVQSFTKLIANKLPTTGLYAKAKDFSDQFHKLPITEQIEHHFETNYNLLFDQIYDFISSSTIKDDQNRKVIFCKAENYSGLSDSDQVKGCLLWFDKWMRLNGHQTEKCFTEDFIVAELSELLYLVTNEFGDSITKKSCVEALNEGTYDYCPEMRCDLHSEDDNLWCALIVAKRSALLFSKAIEPMKAKFNEKSDLASKIGIGRGRGRGHLRQTLKNWTSMKTIC